MKEKITVFQYKFEPNKEATGAETKKPRLWLFYFPGVRTALVEMVGNQLYYHIWKR